MLFSCCLRAGGPSIEILGDTITEVAGFLAPDDLFPFICCSKYILHIHQPLLRKPHFLFNGGTMLKRIAQHGNKHHVVEDAGIPWELGFRSLTSRYLDFLNIRLTSTLDCIVVGDRACYEGMLDMQTIAKNGSWINDREAERTVLRLVSVNHNTIPRSYCLGSLGDKLVMTHSHTLYGIDEEFYSNRYSSVMEIELPRGALGTINGTPQIPEAMMNTSINLTLYPVYAFKIPKKPSKNPPATHPNCHRIISINSVYHIDSTSSPWDNGMRSTLLNSNLFVQATLESETFYAKSRDVSVFCTTSLYDLLSPGDAAKCRTKGNCVVNSLQWASAVSLSEFVYGSIGIHSFCGKYQDTHFLLTLRAGVSVSETSRQRLEMSVHQLVPCPHRSHRCSSSFAGSLKSTFGGSGAGTRRKTQTP
jgi:hypothetical protein